MRCLLFSGFVNAWFLGFYRGGVVLVWEIARKRKKRAFFVLALIKKLYICR